MSEISVSTKTHDAVRLCEMREIPRFLGFLSPSEAAEASTAVGSFPHSFFGGFEGAERTVLGVFPYWADPNDESLFPIGGITFTFREQDKLTHRDFLGSLMALGIKRSSIGDILVGAGVAVVFVLDEMTDFILREVSKVGRVGVIPKIGLPETLPGHGELIEQSTTVASLRLDCVVAALGGMGRTAAAEFIADGRVSVNSVARLKPTLTVNTGDSLSLRGLGRFTVVSTDGLSKKGRIILRYGKYI